MKTIKESDLIELGFEKHEFATIVVIEGPRFSTKAESFMFKNFADIIGMTAFPECALAKEAEIPYQTIAMSTDYDCWKIDEKPVTWDEILNIFEKNAGKMKALLVKIIENLSFEKQILEDEKFIKSKKSKKFICELVARG